MVTAAVVESPCARPSAPISIESGGQAVTGTTNVRLLFRYVAVSVRSSVLDVGRNVADTPAKDLEPAGIVTLELGPNTTALGSLLMRVISAPPGWCVSVESNQSRSPEECIGQLEVFEDRVRVVGRLLRSHPQDRD